MPIGDQVPVVGFHVGDEDRARELLKDYGREYALFRPASFVVIPPPPLTLVVHLADAPKVQQLFAGLLIGEPVADLARADYFEWHAEPSDRAWETLDAALKAFVAAHTADLKQVNTRNLMRRLNARFARLPGVVPNDDLFGRDKPFTYPDELSSHDDFAIELWHENGGFRGRGFVRDYETEAPSAQVEELDGNGDALAKWLLSNLPKTKKENCK